MFYALDTERGACRRGQITCGICRHGYPGALDDASTQAAQAINCSDIEAVNERVTNGAKVATGSSSIQRTCSKESCALQFSHRDAPTSSPDLQI
jgi:hypothetical protein